MSTEDWALSILQIGSDRFSEHLWSKDFPRKGSQSPCGREAPPTPTPGPLAHSFAPSLRSGALGAALWAAMACAPENLKSWGEPWVVTRWNATAIIWLQLLIFTSIWKISLSYQLWRNINNSPEAISFLLSNRFCGRFKSLPQPFAVRAKVVKLQFKSNSNYAFTGVRVYFNIDSKKYVYHSLSTRSFVAGTCCASYKSK